MEISRLTTNYNTSSLQNVNNHSVKKDSITALNSDEKDFEAPLTEAIRLYKGFILTGVRELSKEEKKEIQSMIEEYMEENNFLEKYNRNKVTKEDYAALNDFIQGLFKQFGSKVDFYDYVTDFVDGMVEAAKDPANPPHPPFKVEIPPDHAWELENMQKKPLFTPFQSPSPHQFLTPSSDSVNSQE